MASFGAIAEAPEGVAKLRSLMLSLAMRGGLGTQEQSDESATDLLKRVKEQHLKAVDAKRTKNPKEAPLPLEALPTGWAWAPLGNLLVFGPRNGLSPKPVNYETDTLALTLSATTRGSFDGTKTKFVDVEIEHDSFLWLRAGDILVQRGNTLEYVGVPALYSGGPHQYIYPDLMMKLRVAEGCDPRFIHLAMSETGARDYLRSRASGTSGSMPKINQGTLLSLPLPVPPLAEQKRIVARVDALMSMLDDLEQRQEKKRSAAIHVSKASLDALVEAEDPDQLARAWERVSKNFGVVAGAEGSAHQLRRSVLGLALAGRLTRPTRGDGQTEDLLDIIDQTRRERWEVMERCRIEARGRTPKGEKWKQKYPLAAPPVTESPFDLPTTWAWVTWSRVGLCQNGRSFPSSQYSDSGVPLLRPGNLHASGEVRWTDKNTRHLPESFAEQYPDYLLAPGDLLMNLTAQSLKDAFLGRVCILGAEKGRCLLNQRIGRLLPIQVNPRFVLWLFKAPWFRRYADGLNQGTLIQHMYTNQVDTFAFGLPPLAEQARIVSVVERFMDLIDQLEDRSTHLQQAASNLAIAATRAR